MPHFLRALVAEGRTTAPPGTVRFAPEVLERLESNPHLDVIRQHSTKRLRSPRLRSILTHLTVVQAQGISKPSEAALLLSS